MSRSKRLEKEIDYLKNIISILVALIAGITTWFVHIENEKVASFLQYSSIVLFFIFIVGIIYSHKKIKQLLNDLEKAND